MKTIDSILEEFDKKFFNKALYNLPPDIPEPLRKGAIQLADHFLERDKSIKSFIHSFFTDYRQSLITLISQIKEKMPKKKRKDMNRTTDERRYPTGFNSAIDEVNKLLADLSAIKL